MGVAQLDEMKAAGNLPLMLSSSSLYEETLVGENAGTCPRLHGSVEEDQNPSGQCSLGEGWAGDSQLNLAERSLGHS